MCINFTLLYILSVQVKCVFQSKLLIQFSIIAQGTFEVIFLLSLSYKCYFYYRFWFNDVVLVYI